MKAQEKKHGAMIEKAEKHDSEMAVPSPLMDFFQGVGGGQENLTHVKDPFFKISTGGSRFTISGDAIGQDGVRFNARIMRIAAVRGYYETPFDDDNPQPPDCASVGGIVPDPNSPKKQSDFCAKCPKNKWGTGTDAKGDPSRGKACREAKRLILHVPGISMPVMIGFPPTSLKSVDDFLKKCSNFPGIPGGVPAWAVMAKFSFVAGKKYPCPHVDAAEEGLLTDIAELVKLKELRESDAFVAAERAYATATELASSDEAGGGGDPLADDGGDY